MIRAKDNPFATRKIEELGYIPDDLPLEELFGRFESLGRHALILGPHGSGKTTLLDAMEKDARSRGEETAQVFISLDCSPVWEKIREQIFDLSAGGTVFLDGFDHLSFFRKNRICRWVKNRQIGLLATSHKEGFFPILHKRAPSHQILLDIAARLTGGHGIFSEARLLEIFNAHGGNIRECLRQLYDECRDI